MRWDSVLLTFSWKKTIACLVFFLSIFLLQGCSGDDAVNEGASLNGQVEGHDTPDISSDLGYVNEMGVLVRPDGGSGSSGVDEPLDDRLTFCETDGDCAGLDVFCLGNVCVPAAYGCMSDSDCHQGAYCMSWVGACITGCDESGQCPSGMFCSNYGSCHFPCDMALNDCPNGTECTEWWVSDWPFCGVDWNNILCSPLGVCPEGSACEEATGVCSSNIIR
jgi:hypothetical protein